jgi:hypothetical protein
VSQQDHEDIVLHVLPNEVQLQTRAAQGTRAGWLRATLAAAVAPGLPADRPQAAPPANARAAAAEAAIRRAQRDDGAGDVRNSLMGREQREDRLDKRAMYKLPSQLGRTSSSAALDVNSDDELEVIDPKRIMPMPPARAAFTSSAPAQPVAGPSRIPHQAPPRAPSPGPSRQSNPPAPRAAGARPSLTSSSTAALAFDPAALGVTGIVLGTSSTAELPAFDVRRDALTMRPGEFSVHLVVDYGERKIIPSIKDRVNVYEHRLELGDFIWVARRKVPTGEAERDVFVLDGIMERKRMDDLVSSIKDKRYDDQKVRRAGRPA